MSKPFIASTQYGDLKGTVSVDGFQGPFLQELMTKANMPSGYITVGLTSYLGRPRPHDKELSDRFITFSLVAARADEWDIDKICREARQEGQLNVFRFDLEDLTAGEVLKLIKRLDVKLLLRGFEDIRITEFEDP
jgi:hypothetical protein